MIFNGYPGPLNSCASVCRRRHRQAPVVLIERVPVRRHHDLEVLPLEPTNQLVDEKPGIAALLVTLTTGLLAFIWKVN